MTSKKALAPRLVALIGLLLIASNLRTAVSSLSPIIPYIREDFSLSNLAVGSLGMLPPLCFAISGLLAPILTRRVGLEVALILLSGAIVIGHLIRAFSIDWSTLALGTLLSLVGMGAGNVLLPVVVRKYFRDRMGAMTALYLTVVSISAMIPPLIAVPVAEVSGWRVSLGQWAILGVIAALPWLFELRKNRVDEKVVTESLAIALDVRHIKIWKSATALAMVTIWSVSSINGYAMFAWLPQIMVDYAGESATGAGVMLSLFAGMGLPAALLMPRLAVRFENQAPLIYLSAVFFFTGYGGLIFAPGPLNWVWVTLIGLGPILFPLNLAMFNIRSGSQETLLRISGFAQGFGYLAASLGPLVLGVLHEISGNWTLALWFMFLTAIPAVLAGRIIARKKTIDEELHAHN